MTVKEQATQAKIASFTLIGSSIETRNLALSYMIESLETHKDAILNANIKDLENAHTEGISAPVLARLTFDSHKLEGVIAGIKELISLADPIGATTLRRELDAGLTLFRETTPIGVIGVIFEARPDALVQIASLAIKSGNCAILKGGSEAKYTNQVLFDALHEAILRARLPGDCLVHIESRHEINELLSCSTYVDLLIPRGSNAFVRYIMSHTTIPVMGHSDGICHIFVDADFDLNKAIRIIVDAKTQYPSACNALETLLVHEAALEKLLPPLKIALEKSGVVIRGSKKVREYISCEPASEEDFQTEYLDLILSIKDVACIDTAISHINTYGSHHTDAIITENNATAETFFRYVDSADVYKNCSTRFADGFRYGFGAEVGISTGKLHARGPVGLEGLCTYKYKLIGDGDIVGDYANGIKKFHFKDI